MPSFNSTLWIPALKTPRATRETASLIRRSDAGIKSHRKYDTAPRLYSTHAIADQEQRDEHLEAPRSAQTNHLSQDFSDITSPGEPLAISKEKYANWLAEWSAWKTQQAQAKPSRGKRLSLFRKTPSTLRGDAKKWQVISNNGSTRKRFDHPPSPSSTSSTSKLQKIKKKKIERKNVINVEDFRLDRLPLDTSGIPPLAHGLDRVLFNPGVYNMRDPRTRVYNFDRDIENITPVKDFDFRTILPHKEASRDGKLISLGKEYKRKDVHTSKYVMSSSSITGAMAQIHRLLSHKRDLNLDHLSRSFLKDSGEWFKTQPTKFYAAPSAIMLRWRNGVYAVDADKEFDTDNILSKLGHVMERKLTQTKSDFGRYLTSSKKRPFSEADSGIKNTFQYSRVGKFFLRSQLDAYDPRLPGSGVFDLKSRAVHPIRLNIVDHEFHQDYHIHDRFGDTESFEREQYDLMRGTLTKYSLQARIGNMDGIFIAYHNIKRIFGFQYLSLEDMDLAVHGTSSRIVGDTEFQATFGLLEKIFEKATRKYPRQSIRIHFDADPQSGSSTQTDEYASMGIMNVFAQPFAEEEMEVFLAGKALEARQFEAKLLGLTEEESAETLHTRQTLAQFTDAIESKERDLTMWELGTQNEIEGRQVRRVHALEEQEDYRLHFSLVEQSSDTSHEAFKHCRLRQYEASMPQEDLSGQPESKRSARWKEMTRRSKLRQDELEMRDRGQKEVVFREGEVFNEFIEKQRSLKIFESLTKDAMAHESQPTPRPPTIRRGREVVSA